jgi:hypothetical protein
MTMKGDTAPEGIRHEPGECQRFAGGSIMLRLRTALFVALAVSVIVPLPPVLGRDDPSSKVRGRIQDYEQARRALVIYTKNHAQQAQAAVRETKFFHVIGHERALNGLRCRWDGNDRDKLRRMLEEVAASPAIQLIEPDRRVPESQKP